MVITDMSATGASPTYFDFGAFQEITVTTGGTDLAMQTGGVGINLVTKRGTNNFHGGARYMVADDEHVVRQHARTRARRTTPAPA